MLKHSIFAQLITALLFTLLSAPTTNGQESSWPTNDWPRSTPEAQGMRSEELAAYFETWSQPHFNLDSMVVMRNGHIVAEAYGPLTEPDDIRPMASCTKSITSTLIGVMLQEGVLDSIDTPVLDLFPNKTIENVDTKKQAVTVHDLLTMGSGIECNDISVGPRTPGTSQIMETTDDWLQFALDLPITTDPGTQWYYCNAPVHILSGIITELTGMSALDYAAEKLFAPLDITNYAWANSPDNVTIGYSKLELTPRDMAKLGYLYLNDGQWDSRQIIPADFAQAALGKRIETPWDDTVYGYLWWRIDSINLSFAMGYAGKYIMVLPDKDMVVVVTSTITETPRPGLQTYPLLFSTVGLSTADAPLPENPEAFHELEAIILEIHTPTPQPVPALPALASEISNQVFGLSAPDLLLGSEAYKHHKQYMTPSDQVESLGVNWFMLIFDDSAEVVLNLGFTDEEIGSVPVGLDGIYRVSESRLGTIGVKGEWLGDSTFRVYIREKETHFLHRIDINFMPGGIDVISYEYASGQAIALQGIEMSD